MRTWLPPASSQAKDETLNITAEDGQVGAKSQGLLAEERLLGKPWVSRREKTIIELWVLFIDVWGWLDVDSKQAVELVGNSKEPSCVMLSQEPLGMRETLPLPLADLVGFVQSPSSCFFLWIVSSEGQPEFTLTLFR